MKILIIGAGVIGSVYAAKLARCSHDITLLARGTRYEEIKTHGLVLKHFFTGEEIRQKVHLIFQIGYDDYDLVFVIVRGNQREELLPFLQALTRAKCFLFIGNQLQDVNHLMQVLGRNRVLLGFGSVAGYKEGYTIWYTDSDAAGRKIALLRCGAIHGSRAGKIGEIRNVFAKAGYPVKILKQPVAWLKCHLLIILPLLAIIINADFNQQKAARDREYTRFAVKTFKELISLFRKGKIPIQPAGLLLLYWLPEKWLIRLIATRLTTPGAKIGIFGHAQAHTTQEEMAALAFELNTLLKAIGKPTPYWDQLYPRIINYRSSK